MILPDRAQKKSSQDSTPRVDSATSTHSQPRQSHRKAEADASIKAAALPQEADTASQKRKSSSKGAPEAPEQQDPGTDRGEVREEVGMTSPKRESSGKAEVDGSAKAAALPLEADASQKRKSSSKGAPEAPGQQGRGTDREEVPQEVGMTSPKRESSGKAEADGSAKAEALPQEADTTSQKRKSSSKGAPEAPEQQDPGIEREEVREEVGMTSPKRESSGKAEADGSAKAEALPQEADTTSQKRKSSSKGAPEAPEQQDPGIEREELPEEVGMTSPKRESSGKAEADPSAKAEALPQEADTTSPKRKSSSKGAPEAPEQQDPGIQREELLEEVGMTSPKRESSGKAEADGSAKAEALPQEADTTSPKRKSSSKGAPEAPGQQDPGTDREELLEEVGMTSPKRESMMKAGRKSLEDIKPTERRSLEGAGPSSMGRDTSRSISKVLDPEDWDGTREDLPAGTLLEEVREQHKRSSQMRGLEAGPGHSQNDDRAEKMQVFTSPTATSRRSDEVKRTLQVQDRMLQPSRRM